MVVESVLGAAFPVDMRSRNRLSEQGYPNRSPLIGRAPGCGRFTAVGTNSGAVLSADDKSLEELPIGAKGSDGLALAPESPPNRTSNAVTRDCKASICR
ncbi:hypothetical protein LguiA_031275 [Lonicera macranthoides]